ncbi:phage tail protein [Paenibacillus sp. MBLB4367]|uniref:phage tail protein n=1 Tax=Paenibacillus sp. MBLB4367 TaxID=3384767 RepID=UPI0039081B72
MSGESSFFSLNKPEDWGRGYAHNLHIAAAGIGMNRTEKYGVKRIIRLSELERLAGLADFTPGTNGKLYVMDQTAALWSYDYENKHAEPVFREWHGQFTNEAMLAASGDMLFVADPAGERKVAAYSVSNGQAVWTADSWDGNLLFPLAVACDEAKNVYVATPLDMLVGVNGNSELPENGAVGIIRFDPSGSPAMLYTHELLRVEEPIMAAQLHRRYAVAVHGGRLALFDTEKRLVIVFGEGGDAKSAFSLTRDMPYAGFSIDANQHIYVGDCRYVRSDAEDDRYILRFDEEGRYLAPISGFRGRCDKLLFDRRGRMYVLNGETEDITLLELQHRTMAMKENGLPEGVYFAAALDSAEEETEWHKVWLDADIPEETQIRISVFASDRRMQPIGGIVTDMGEYLADPAVDALEKLRATAHLWSEPVVNPQDALLRHAKGRYLWVSIRFIGSEHETPVIRKLRIYFPRQSLLDYLPPIYQEHPQSRDFLHRYLALFDTFLQGTEEKIDRMARFFDPDSVSGDYLKWLGTWMGIAEDESWEESKRRQLIRMAPELYKERGTRRAIERMLELVTGHPPILIEYFEYKSMREQSELSRLLGDLYGDNPYVFCILMRPECVETEAQRLFIQKIVDEQKPVFTEAKLVVLQEWMFMDMHTYTGINTVLSEPTLLTLDEKSSMPYNTILIDVDRDRRMDQHTRLELDSDLE